MKTLLFTLALMTTVSAMAETRTKDPLRYAETATARYAEATSDTGPYGLDSCSFPDSIFGKFDIHCVGHNTVLVHGGHESTGVFDCLYTFQRTHEGFREFTILSEDCE